MLWLRIRIINTQGRLNFFNNNGGTHSFSSPRQVISIRTTTSTTSTTTPGTITLDDKAKNVLKKSRQSAYNLLKHVRQNEVIPPKQKNDDSSSSNSDQYDGLTEDQLYKIWSQKQKKKKKQKRKKKGRKPGGGIPDMLTITKAKDMFILSDEDLEHLHYSERPNPKSQFFSNMKLYDINDVLEVAREKYGDANGFLNFALAAKRKTTAAPKIVGSTNSQTSTTQDNNNVPAYVVAETWDIKRFHFLMQFTLFPVIRNEKLAFQLWVERFPNVNTAKEFPFLPTCMKDDVDNTMERFVGRKDGGGFGYSILPNLSVLWDVEQLQLQDEKGT